jgi:hypothetical protein
MGISSEFWGKNSNPGGRSQNLGTGPEVVLANNSISSFFNLFTPQPEPSPYAVGDLIPYRAGFLKYVNIKKNEKNIWVLHLKDKNNKEYSVQIQKQDMPTQSAIRDQLKNTNLEIPSSALFKKPSAPQQPTQQPTSQSSSAPKPGDTREADVDPDGAGPQKGTYVSVPSKDGSSFQTRLVKLQAFNGTKWVDQGYGVRGIIQVHNQKQRQLTKTSLDFVGVTDRSQAEERARAWLSNSPQVTGKPRTVVAPQPVETFKTARLAITTGNVALSGPTQARGFIELLDQQVAPDAQRYLQAGNALIGLSGSDLQNFVGVAMDLAPNVARVPGRGNQLLYQGEVLTPIGTVSAALRAAGGEAPRVRPVPVYLRVGDNQLAKTVIFRVQGRDGRERIVDNVGRTYDSLKNWKQHNQLGAVEVFLPQGGQMTGRDGKVLLEAFNNRRFDNTALPVVRGGVAILGAAAGVAVMLGTGGVAAPLVMAGGAVFSVADSGVTLADRFQHGQTLNLTNQQARAAWLDFGAGLLGAGAIGSGLKGVARASDLADVLTLGNSVTDLAIDWNKLSPGERALAGAQLAFWSAMLGASKFSGGRFNLDPLTKPGGGRGGDPNVKPTNSRTDPPPTKKQVEEQVTQQLSPQGIQQLSTKVFSSPDFQTRLVEALKGKEQLASDQAGLRNLAQKVALDTVVKRTFDGSGVPSNVQLNFRLLAEQWAKQQVKKDGGTTAGWLEALVTHNNSSAHRADMLRSSVAQHLGGGNKRLQNAVGAQLGELSEAQLKNLVAPGSGGAPQKAAVTILRDALVNRWAEDFKLSQKQKDQLGANLDQQLQNKKPNTQLEYLRKLDTNAKVRKSLVSDVQNPQGAENTAVTNPPTQNPPKTPKPPKTVGSPNPNPNLNPNTSDITFPPQIIEVILKAISTAGGYEEAMTELKNLAAISDIPLPKLTEIPAVKERLKLLKTNQGTPSNGTTQPKQLVQGDVKVPRPNPKDFSDITIATKQLRPVQVMSAAEKGEIAQFLSQVNPESYPTPDRALTALGKVDQMYVLRNKANDVIGTASLTKSGKNEWYLGQVAAAPRSGAGGDLMKSLLGDFKQLAKNQGEPVRIWAYTNKAENVYNVKDPSQPGFYAQLGASIKDANPQGGADMTTRRRIEFDWKFDAKGQPVATRSKQPLTPSEQLQRAGVPQTLTPEQIKLNNDMGTKMSIAPEPGRPPLPGSITTTLQTRFGDVTLNEYPAVGQGSTASSRELNRIARELQRQNAPSYGRMTVPEIVSQLNVRLRSHFVLSAEGDRFGDGARSQMNLTPTPYAAAGDAPAGVYGYVGGVVSKPAEGGLRGGGTPLMNAAKDVARREGWVGLRLYTDTSEGVDFYVKNGFRNVQSGPAPDGSGRTRTYMLWTVNEPSATTSTQPASQLPNQPVNPPTTVIPGQADYNPANLPDQVPRGRYGETLAGQSNTPQATNPPVDLSQVPRNPFVPNDQLTPTNNTGSQAVTEPLSPGSLTGVDLQKGIDQLASQKRTDILEKLEAGPWGGPGRLMTGLKNLNDSFSVIPETLVGNVHIDWQRLEVLRKQLEDPAVKRAINEIGLMNLSEPDRPVNLREAGLEFPLPKSVSENLLNGKLPQNIRELYQLEIALQDPALSKAFSPNANSNVNPDAEELRKTSLFKTLTKDQLSRIPASILKYDQPQTVGLVSLTKSATEFAVDRVEGVKALAFNDVNKKIALSGAAVLGAQFGGNVLHGKGIVINGPNSNQPVIVKNLNIPKEGEIIGITTTPNKPSNNYVAASGNLGLSVRESPINRFQFKSGGSANPAPQIRSNIVRIAELAVGFNFSVLDGELGVRGAVAANLGGTQNPIYLSTGDTVAGKLPASAAAVSGGVGVSGYFGVVIGPYILAVRNPAGFGAIGTARSTVGVSGTPGAYNLGLGEAIYNNPSSKIDIGKLWRNFSEGAPFEIPVDIKDIQVVQNPTPEDFKSYQLELFKGGGWRYLEPQQAQEAVLREEFLIPLLEKYAQYGPEKFVSQFDDPNTRRFIKDNLEVFQKMSAVYSEGGVDALGISNDRP